MSPRAERIMAKATSEDRMEVRKTYKIYVGGKFPRTESGRFYAPEVKGKPIGNICLCSRKDVRNSIVAARAAQSGWAGRTAFNRGQILYRIAEMLDGRREQFVAELQKQGLAASVAKNEVELSVGRLIYYAGWCDKYQQIFSSVNPVSSSHFNFSVLEPMGVVFIVASETSPLLGLVSVMAPVIASGNSCVVLASERMPLSSVTFAEVLNSSDLPGGVVNVLTGKRSELTEHFAQHLDVNGVAYDGRETDYLKSLKEFATTNVKRVRNLDVDWTDSASQNPYLIRDYCEVKTTWHPIETISASGSGY